MTTNRYVVAPRVATQGMVDNVPVCATSMSEIWEYMLAAIPDDPNAPVLVSRDYVKAVEDFCVVSWVNPPAPDANYETTKKALCDVACFDVQVATDPATNGGKVLVERDEWEAIQSVCDVVDTWALTDETVIALERVEALIGPLRRIVAKERGT